MGQRHGATGSVADPHTKDHLARQWLHGNAAIRRYRSRRRRGAKVLSLAVMGQAYGRRESAPRAGAIVSSKTRPVVGSQVITKLAWRNPLVADGARG